MPVTSASAAAAGIGLQALQGVQLAVLADAAKSAEAVLPLLASPPQHIDVYA